jgi:hypothetical protein
MERFKLIVAGGRDFDDYALVEKTLDSLLENKVNEGFKIIIVSGACDRGKLTYVRPDGTEVFGADGLGERYAAEKGYEVYYYPAQWNLYGTYAGPIRNKLMATISTAAAIFWNGYSRGSKNMIDEANKQKIPTRVIRF